MHSYPTMIEGQQMYQIINVKKLELFHDTSSNIQELHEQLE